MSANGRPRSSTAFERAEVRRLHAEGVSVRKIAATVFGEVRFRGRVERILGGPVEKRPSREAVAEAEAALREFESLGTAGQLRWLLDRRMRDLAARDQGPSARELLALVRVERQLHGLEALERLQGLHVERRGRAL